MTNTTKQNMLKKILLIGLPIIAVLGVLIFTIANIASSSQPKTTTSEGTTLRVYYFYSRTCSHCAKASPFLDKIEENNPEVELFKYEVGNPENSKKMLDVENFLDDQGGGVPYVIIGDQPIRGFGEEETTGEQYKSRIRECINGSCPDKVGTEVLGFDQIQTN